MLFGIEIVSFNFYVYFYVKNQMIKILYQKSIQCYIKLSPFSASYNLILMQNLFLCSDNIIVYF